MNFAWFRTTKEKGSTLFLQFPDPPGTIFSNLDKKRRKNEIGPQKFLRGVEEFCLV